VAKLRRYSGCSVEYARARTIILVASHRTASGLMRSDFTAPFWCQNLVTSERCPPGFGDLRTTRYQRT
jgi:hypothetical protein